ncbi:MAG: hypothetical protein IKZ78_01770 [Firmicutes bacterium]|nr:hypothetical protein [Bacillota bacterium]
MDVRIEPSKYWGKVSLPPSRVEMHRKIIIGTLAGAGRIDGSDDCDDTKASFDAAYALVRTYPEGREPEIRKVRCKKSSSALRMLLPVSGVIGKTFCCEAEDPVSGYDVKPFTEVLKSHGMQFESDSLPLISRGKLTSGNYELTDTDDSEFISGLLMALPFVEGDSTLVLKAGAYSRPVIDITVKCLESFGVQIGGVFGDWKIKGGQTAVLPEPPKKAYEYVNPNYKHKFKKHQNPTSPGSGIKCERDWSIASNYIVANSFGSEVSLEGLNENSEQPERRINDMLKSLGGYIDVGDVPSLIPILAVAACGKQGVTRLIGCSKFVKKEKNRVQLTVKMINDIGGNAEYSDGTIIINGSGSLKGGKVDPEGDHRVAMAACIAAQICEKGIDILGANCVSKSCLNYFMDSTWLGAKMYYNV